MEYGCYFVVPVSETSQVAFLPQIIFILHFRSEILLALKKVKYVWLLQRVKANPLYMIPARQTGDYDFPFVSESVFLRFHNNNLVTTERSLQYFICFINRSYSI